MPSNDQDLARLYAEYLAQQTPPTYDDGASLLRGNPMALEVGLFGKGPKPKPVAPPVDIQRRRILGLNDIPEQKPSTQLPAISTPSSVAPAPTPAQAPLSSMAYKALTTPMSRRQFLGNTARTAGQMALRGAVPELAKLAETSQKFPLQEMATQAAPKDPYADIWDVLKGAIGEQIYNSARDDALTFEYDALRDELGVENLPKDLVDLHNETRNRIDELENSEHTEYEALMDEYGSLMYRIGDLIDHAPASHVFNLMERYGVSTDAADIAEWLRSNDFTPEQIHDFLDTHYPYYDEDAVNEVLRNFED